MKTINNIYPIFEADQVLSQKHLNKLVTYLEEQDRVSRTNLIGMGIVCGLEINKPNNTTINISCGTGVSSVGYLISLDASEYTHYKETTILENFLNPDIEPHDYLGDIYDYSSVYNPFKDCFELLKNDSEDEGKEPLTAAFLEDKIVMLLLEVSLIDKKNCDTTNCDDKGKALKFKLRPLLVDKELIDEEIFDLDSCTTNYFETIPVPKYNVTKTNLVTGNQVLDQFYSLITSIKQNVNTAIKAVHNYYKSDFDSLPNYSSLFQVINKIDAIQAENSNGIYIQYVWDWVCDLVATHKEIVVFNTCNPAVCCLDMGKFPFHVLLGSAKYSTLEIEADDDFQKYRTHFIKTGVFVEEEKSKKQELKSLLEKLIHQVNNFDINSGLVEQEGIKITPSVLGNYTLSQKAIPYYYDDIVSLHKKWSSEKNQKNKSDEILSYYSKKYNTSDDFVINPLKYDNEPYNFYRIEGHIGRNYIEGLTDIISQQKLNRLPFKVVALNALSFLNKEIDISKHSGDWQALELDYDLAKIKVYNITEHVINWITVNKTKLIENSLMAEVTINNLKDILTQSRNLLKENLQEFLPEYEGFFNVFKELNNLFLLHRFCILLANQNELSDLAEDLIDHLDEINSLFLEDPFTVIFEEAHRRWKEEYKEIFLSKFLEKHSGINHKSGVPKGGTFIIVYTDSSIFKRKLIIKGHISELLITRINDYKKVFNYTPKRIKEITAVNKLKSRPIVIKDDSTNDCDEEIAKAKGNLLKSAKLNLANDMPLAIREYLFGNLEHFFEPSGLRGDGDNNRTIPERKIIADFYLPYICCSKGNNINIMLPTIEEEVTIADFDGNDFDKNDFFTNKQ